MVGPPFKSTVGLVSAAAIVGLTFWIFWSRKKRGPPPTLKVGTVSSLIVYPVKSVQGLKTEEAECTTTGLQLPGPGIADRSFVIATKDYNIITQRQEPSLALIKLCIQGHQLHLDAPNMETLILNTDYEGQACTVKVFGSPISALDYGEEASIWFSKFLNKEDVRFCRASTGPTRRFLRELKGGVFDVLIPFYKKARKEDEIFFSDGGPYLVVSDSSLEDLNSRMDIALSMRPFRASVTVSGCPPYDEDTWRSIQIGEARFKFILHVPRCTMTQVNPDTGIRREDKEPLKTLSKYRIIEPSFPKDPCFGALWTLEKPGVTRVGDPVYASRESYK